MKLTEYDESMIVSNITHAKDKKKQLSIEAELNAISKGDVKEILKKHGVSLKIFNGGRHEKKHIEDKLAEEASKAETPAEQEDIEELNILTDVQDILSKEEELSENEIKIPYKKPEIIEPPLPKSSESVENAADSTDCEQASADDFLIIGPNILEDDQIIYSVTSKIYELVKERKAHQERIDKIDAILRKYSYFSADISNYIESEGVEL
ncbi:hypothetical protein [uncultured Ruminococcus sp.]|uniref:hypothetical protein n=1 Tax=uncultured Ruminococcus sp. TaxID=165186 RepID=UPI0025EEB151|nr:hypothetical protein [uncultured Ruminococcus sp.]